VDATSSAPAATELSLPPVERLALSSSSFLPSDSPASTVPFVYISGTEIRHEASGGKSFAMYKVHTKAASGAPSAVYRRFSEFVTLSVALEKLTADSAAPADLGDSAIEAAAHHLRRLLCLEQSGLPKLPGQNVANAWNGSTHPSVVAARRSELEGYLNATLKVLNVDSPAFVAMTDFLGIEPSATVTRAEP